MVLVSLGGCHLLDGLVVCLHRETRKKIVRYSGEVIVRGIVLTWREPRRATLVERDSKGNKWSGRIARARALHVRECDLRVTTSKRIISNLGACLNGD